jgi:hypothetical protein
MKQAVSCEAGWPSGHLDKVFLPGGHWESNGGRGQTAGFAKCFVKNVTIPLDDFSLLDVGCALGDASPVFKSAYPKARLFGCDVSEVAIERCKTDYGHIADFFKSGLEELSGSWDVIYCSNVLEHFREYMQAASWLVSKCRIAYIVTPYFELRDGRELTFSADGQHGVTFYRNSFDTLYEQGLISSPAISKVIRCPKVYSPPWPKEILRAIRRMGKMVFFRRYFPPKGRQIIYELHNKA